MLRLGALSLPERRLLARLWQAGATSEGTAHPLPGLRGAPMGWQQRLISSGLLALDAEGRGYINEIVYRRAVWARRAFHAVLVLGSVALAGILTTHCRY